MESLKDPIRDILHRATRPARKEVQIPNGELMSLGTSWNATALRSTDGDGEGLVGLDKVGGGDRGEV